MIFDSEIIPEGVWGIRPILFKIGNLNIEAYPFFVSLAILVGIIVFYLDAKKHKSANEKTFYIVIAALVGGTLGSKLPVWIFNFKEIINSLPDLTLLLSGRTIVGGLIGGTLGVMLIKKHLKINEKKGNFFAPAIAIGIAIGRIGCFLRGCCYGISTKLPWGVDFGDGILRHPTQLYESLFALIMFFYLQKAKKKNPKPGELFRTLMVSYFIFRFLIEFIRVESKIFLGLSGFQWASLLVLAYYFATSESLRRFINNRRVK